MINFRTSADYVQESRALIAGSESFESEIYDDGEGIPTIGYGYALIVKRSDGRWGEKLTLEEEFSSVQQALSPNELSVLDEVAAALNAGDKALASKLIADTNFTPFLDEWAAGKLFEFDLVRAEGAVESRFRVFHGQAGVDAVEAAKGSYEFMVMASLVFNSPQLIGKGLSSAVMAGDRAEAWYQIRYDSNKLARKQIEGLSLSSSEKDSIEKGIDDGLAKRRFMESAVFSLYDYEVTDSTIDEQAAIDVYRMYTERRGRILAYERKYGVAIDGTSPGRNMLSDAQQTLSSSGLGFQVETLEESLFPATVKLQEIGLDNLGVDVPQINFADIQVAATNGGFLNGTLRTDNGVLNEGAARSDLMIGQEGVDLLNGGGARDVLHGNGGVDVLRGGIDDDVLLGGGGRDIYFYHPGDGDDVIIDDDGHGVIVFDPDNEAITLSAAFREPGDEPGFYQTPDGNITYQWNGEGTDLVITFAGYSGGSITVKNYSQGQFGIQLTELPTEVVPDGRTPREPDDPDLDPLVFTGTEGGDLIEGGIGADDIHTLGGDDYVNGGDGSDLIIGYDEQGNIVGSHLDGGTGSDAIGGTSGDDRIYAGFWDGDTDKNAKSPIFP